MFCPCKPAKKNDARSSDGNEHTHSKRDIELVEFWIRDIKVKHTCCQWPPLASFHVLQLEYAECLNFLRRVYYIHNCSNTSTHSGVYRERETNFLRLVSVAVDTGGNPNDFALSPRPKIGTQRVYQGLRPANKWSTASIMVVSFLGQRLQGEPFVSMQHQQEWTPRRTAAGHYRVTNHRPSSFF